MIIRSKDIQDLYEINGCLMEKEKDYSKIPRIKGGEPWYWETLTSSQWATAQATVQKVTLKRIRTGPPPSSSRTRKKPKTFDGLKKKEVEESPAPALLKSEKLEVAE